MGAGGEGVVERSMQHICLQLSVCVCVFSLELCALSWAPRVYLHLVNLRNKSTEAGWGYNFPVSLFPSLTLTLSLSLSLCFLYHFPLLFSFYFHVQRHLKAA